MTNLRWLKPLVFIGMLLPIVMSCAGMKTRISPKSSVQTSAPVKDFSQTSSQTPAQAANPAKKHMEAGEYQKAIDVYNVEYQKHPHDLSIAREYVKSIENIASAADKALDKKDYASAGRKYDVLLKNYAHFKGFEKKLSFNSIYLNEKLSYCKKALLKLGFQEYRKGNLSEAIELWQDLLVIDPQNTDIEKALRTAKLQQKNLQEKK
jgi:tetratricopeptide (TPR) repeat protein